MKSCFYPAQILLPSKQDMERWAVVACDQFTSEPDYWENVDRLVGDAPSTLRLILPEVYLKAPDVDERIRRIDETMTDYLERGVFARYDEALVYVERRQSDGRVRHGLVGMVDLDCYDYRPGSDALIRATEATVTERIPPRARVRRGAPVELPHVMLLIDDPEGTVIEPLTAGAEEMELLYDFELMQQGGHLTGRLVTAAQKEAVSAALAGLCADEAQQAKYGLAGAAPLLFAVGDGNHSLATAKACWEEVKKTLSPAQQADHPARFALVEVVNLHDAALQVEPIHRVVFGAEPDKLMAAFRRVYPAAHPGRGEGHTIEFVWQGHDEFITVPHPEKQLTVATLQSSLDGYLAENGGEIDYIHGDDVTRRLGSQPGNVGFLLPVLGKEQLFKTVMADGVLPRKTFSMGHAADKRYYVEARKIVK